MGGLERSSWSCCGAAARGRPELGAKVRLAPGRRLRQHLLTSRTAWTSPAWLSAGSCPGRRRSPGRSPLGGAADRWQGPTPARTVAALLTPAQRQELARAARRSRAGTPPPCLGARPRYRSGSPALNSRQKARTVPSSRSSDGSNPVSGNSRTALSSDSNRTPDVAAEFGAEPPLTYFGGDLVTGALPGGHLLPRHSQRPTASRRSAQREPRPDLGVHVLTRILAHLPDASITPAPGSNRIHRPATVIQCTRGGLVTMRPSSRYENNGEEGRRGTPN